jgi:hypothetical protein
MHACQRVRRTCPAPPACHAAPRSLCHPQDARVLPVLIDASVRTASALQAAPPKPRHPAGSSAGLGLSGRGAARARDRRTCTDVRRAANSCDTVSCMTLSALLACRCALSELRSGQSAAAAAHPSLARVVLPSSRSASSILRAGPAGHTRREQRGANDHTVGCALQQIASSVRSAPPSGTARSASISEVHASHTGRTSCQLHTFLRASICAFCSSSAVRSVDLLIRSSSALISACSRCAAFACQSRLFR